jgi:hypothetical protein
VRAPLLSSELRARRHPDPLTHHPTDQQMFLAGRESVIMFRKLAIVAVVTFLVNTETVTQVRPNILSLYCNCLKYSDLKVTDGPF